MATITILALSSLLSHGNVTDAGADYCAFDALLHLIIALFYTLLYFTRARDDDFFMRKGYFLKSFLTFPP